MVPTSWRVVRMKGEDAGQSLAHAMHSVLPPTVLQYPALLFFGLGVVEVLTPCPHYGWMKWMVCEGHQITSVGIASQ